MTRERRRPGGPASRLPWGRRAIPRPTHVSPLRERTDHFLTAERWPRSMNAIKPVRQSSPTLDATEFGHPGRPNVSTRKGALSCDANCDGEATMRGASRPMPFVHGLASTKTNGSTNYGGKARTFASKSEGRSSLVEDLDVGPRPALVDKTAESSVGPRPSRGDRCTYARVLPRGDHFFVEGFVGSSPSVQQAFRRA